MRDRGIVARHGLNISPAAAVAYLSIKKALLESEVLWDVSDSAVIEYLCARHYDPNLSPHEFKPQTHDGRKPENIHGAGYTHTGQEKSGAEILRGHDRINDTILKRKKNTDERLAYFKSYPARSRARRRSPCAGG